MTPDQLLVKSLNALQLWFIGLTLIDDDRKGTLSLKTVINSAASHDQFGIEGLQARGAAAALYQTNKLVIEFYHTRIIYPDYGPMNIVYMRLQAVLK